MLASLLFNQVKWLALLKKKVGKKKNLTRYSRVSNSKIYKAGPWGKLAQSTEKLRGSGVWILGFYSKVENPALP